ncbi:membrane protein insertion efficiency factor YidD [Parvibaculum sp.]|uniref:membrane protein insertion efficiency factor YidD n=1 Tax=Parvibaculum sp. TaxID=2024848 RepID=UPI000C898782|nr:hypothetical protein [Parvibaculum sp.]
MDRLAAILAIGTIKLYRLSLSPLVGGDCLFNPTCSVFAEKALQEHGWTQGIALSVRRLEDCSGGYSLFYAGDGCIMMRTRSGDICGEECFSEKMRSKVTSFKSLAATAAPAITDEGD